MISSRRNYLYGPKRETTNTAIKDFLLNDHVFSKNDCKVNKTLETTNHECFGKKSVKLDRETARLSTEIQRTSNFEFGYDLINNHPLMTTTSFEFCKHVLPTAKSVNHDFYSTNIPDFSHSHSQGKMVGDDGSIYDSSYQTFGTSMVKGGSRDMQRKQTDDMRSTHFNLGSDKQRIPFSETLHSYHNRYLTKHPNETAFTKTGTSSVFRCGDWNMNGPCLTTTSVSQDDFNSRKHAASSTSRNYASSEISKNNHSEPGRTNGFAAKCSTNFMLGDDKCLSSSLYQKDFLLKKSQCPLKPLKTARPKSSKFLQQTPGMVCPKSTKESDFVCVKHNEALDFVKNRLCEFERNQGRHKVSCVALSVEQDGQTLKQVSMSLKDYQEPPNELLRSHTLHRRPAPKYDYILLDKGLVEPQYRTTQMDRELRKDTHHSGESLDANQSSTSKGYDHRSRDDHQTHFAFGSDYLSTVESEQHDQFTHKTPLDPCYPAAGNIKLPAIVCRSPQHISRVRNNQDQSHDEPTKKSSVMKTDYQPSTKQRVSSAQRRILALNLKYPPVIATSHYFHMNHGNERTLSTTTTDYIPPELMAGQPEIVTAR